MNVIAEAGEGAAVAEGCIAAAAAAAAVVVVGDTAQWMLEEVEVVIQWWMRMIS